MLVAPVGAAQAGVHLWTSAGPEGGVIFAVAVDPQAGTLYASATPVPDIVALAATVNNDGIVALPAAIGTGAFAVATANVGAAGSIVVSADTGAASLPINISLCQTNPVTGACLASPAASALANIGANATPTFAIFVAATDTIPFDPGSNRVFVRFNDASGATRGATSVAVRTQ